VKFTDQLFDPKLQSRPYGHGSSAHLTWVRPGEQMPTRARLRAAEALIPVSWRRLDDVTRLVDGLQVVRVSGAAR
jgi:hypothetical protein